MGEQMNIQKHYDEVLKFNKIGKSFDEPFEAVCLYVDLIKEELAETITALHATGDSVELLDGACDVFVVTCGLLQAMEKAGFNVDEALRRVTKNNNDKFVPSLFMSDYPSDYSFEDNEEYGVIVIKDNKGKIRKPVGFEPVTLDDLVPDNFFGGEA
jgi:hypothetical protein